jgi:hypothetical protein
MGRVKLAAAAIAAGAFALPLPMLAGTAHAFPCPPGTPPGACGGGGHGGGGGQMPGGGGWGGPPVQHAPQAPMQPPVEQAPVQPPVQQAPVVPPPVRQVPQEAPAEPPPALQQPVPPQNTEPIQTPVQQTPVQHTPEAPVQPRTPVHTPPSQLPEQGSQAPSQHSDAPTTPAQRTPVTEPEQTPRVQSSDPPSHEGTLAAPTPPTKQVVTPQPSAPPPRPGGSPQPVTSAPQRGGPTEGPNQRQVSQAPVPPPVKVEPARVEQAKNATPVVVDPIKPPPPPPGPAQAMLAGDMASQVTRAVNNPTRQVDVVRDGDKAVVHPQHWNYQDYDQYHRPRIYNPLNVPLRIHYFYENAYRDVVVPALGLAVLAVADAGVYPYTAVGGDDYVTAGYFDGGAWIPPAGWDGPPPNDYLPPAPPPQFTGVTAYVPAADQNVGLDKVTLAGHDDNAPVGQQDTMMLNDTTLAWGQVDDPKDGGHVTIQKTQPTPGVGPTDDGRSIILAAKQQPINKGWQKWVLGGILAVVAAVGAGTLWIVRHPKTAPEEWTEPVIDEGPSLGSLVETPTDMHSTEKMADPDHAM